eukprot:3073643-Rhodomonas_salina.1
MHVRVGSTRGSEEREHRTSHRVCRRTARESPEDDRAVNNMLVGTSDGVLNSRFLVLDCLRLVSSVSRL